VLVHNDLLIDVTSDLSPEQLQSLAALVTIAH